MAIDTTLVAQPEQFEWGGTWVEIPRHRIFIVGLSVLQADYEFLDANGVVVERAGDIENPALLVRRKRDSKLFRYARYEPSSIGQYVALVEA